MAKMDRTKLLDAVTSRTKVIALVALVAEGVLAIAIFAIPGNQRLEAFCGCIIILGIVLGGCIWLEGKEMTRKSLFTVSRIPDAKDNVPFKGPVIDGNWLSFEGVPDSADSYQDGTADIQQTGQKISMRLHMTVSRTREPVNRTFVYQGEFRSGQLVALFDDEQASGYILGAIVLRLSSDLKRLIGKSTFYRDVNNGVVSFDFWLQRP